MKRTCFQIALDIVRTEIKKDKGLYMAYQSAIAVSFQDTLAANGYRFPNTYEITNEAAIAFLEMWLKKDTK